MPFTARSCFPPVSDPFPSFVTWVHQSLCTLLSSPLRCPCTPVIHTQSWEWEWCAVVHAFSVFFFSLVTLAPSLESRTVSGYALLIW